MTKKKFKQIYTLSLIVALPVALFIFVYKTNIPEPYQVASAKETTTPATTLATASTKPVVLATTQTAEKKPVVKKAAVKKKVVKKKKAKRKEKLITQPVLYTTANAPHTGR